MKQKGVYRYFSALLILIGILSVAAAGLLWCMIHMEDGRAAAASAAALDEFRNLLEENRASAVAREPGFSEDNSREPPSGFGSGGTEKRLSIEGREYIGYLRFVETELELPVLADWNFRDLRVAPVRFSGSVTDGQLVIAGHNTRAHFHILHSLKEGDGIIFIDATGAETRFRVDKLETLRATDVSAMTSGSWDLTLFTCTYGGKARLTVRCRTEQDTSDIKNVNLNLLDDSKN